MEKANLSKTSNYILENLLDKNSTLFSVKHFTVKITVIFTK